jgi:6-phosphogluconolactonase
VSRPAPDVVVEIDADRLARAAAEAFVARVAAAQAVHGSASVVLTGGGIGIAVLEHVAGLAAEPVRETVDWEQIDVWWGDERFVPAADDDRNAKQVLDLIRAPLGLDPARVHEMPASDGGMDLDEAAAAYAAELDGTEFDICLLGLGPDGHVASLFPDHPSARTPGTVIAVRDSPKPPPLRTSVTLEVINASREVWFLVSGEDKADATARALLRTGPDPVPGARVEARERTLWLMDTAATTQLPGTVELRRA